MDKKYIISVDENYKIEWVGINTSKGLVLRQMTNQYDRKAYKAQIDAIDKEFGGFKDEILGKNLKVENTSFFENEVKKMQEVKHSAAFSLRNKINKKGAAIALALILGSGTLAYGLAGKLNIPIDKLGAIALGSKPKTETSQEVTKGEEEVVDLASKTVPELIDMLNEEDQERAFKKIVGTQDYFNEVAAPTVSPENGKQLYFTFDEVVAAYIYANAQTQSTEKMAGFFGKSKIYLKDKENEIYEELDADRVSDSFVTFARELGYYYLSGATEPSGIGNEETTIFESEEEAAYFRKIENLVLAYNKDHSEENKEALREALEEFFMSGSIESPKEKYPGVAAMLEAILPYAHFHGVIDRETFESYTEMLETIICDETFNEIEKIFNCKLKKNGKEDIIEMIARKQNEKVKGLDRDYELEVVAFNSQELENGYGGYGYYGGSSSRTVTTHKSYDTKDRKHAVKVTSEKEVKRAEEKARKEIDKKNEKEKKKEKELKEGYNDTYDDSFNGKGDNRDKNRSDDYNKGADAGVKAGEEDRKQAEKDMNEYNKNHEQTREEVISETFTPDTNTPQKPDPVTPKPEPKVVETVEEDTTIHGNKPKHVESNNSSNSNSGSSSSNSNSGSSSSNSNSGSSSSNSNSGSSSSNSNSGSSSSNSNSGSSNSHSEPKVVETVEEDTTIYGSPSSSPRLRVTNIKRYYDMLVNIAKNTTGKVRTR